MMQYDVIIIGGGPAGLFTAIQCAMSGLQVALLEKNKSFGKKLLLTGAGKCNLTQDGDMGAFLHHYGTNSRFVKPCLYAFTNADFRKFLYNNNLSTVSVENGKVFPQSMRAIDVLNVFEKACRLNQVDMLTQTEVKHVSKDGELFVVNTERSTFYCRSLVISTGGVTFPQTGSTGDGHIFAKKFNHKIRSTKFALAPLAIKDFELSAFSGVSFENLAFTHWREGKKVGSYTGDVLITHRGLSGPGIMNHSRYMQKHDVINLNFLGGSAEDAKCRLIALFAAGGKKLVRSVIYELDLPKRLADFLLRSAGVQADLKCAELTKAVRTKLLILLSEYQMEIKSVGSAQTAMVTAGGVSLADVSPKTMESRKVENLYFVGEILDVDGDTGGYNIQVAVSMGYVAAAAIRKKPHEV